MSFLSRNQQYQSTEGKYHIPQTCSSQAQLGSFNVVFDHWRLLCYLEGELPSLSSALWCQHAKFEVNSDIYYPVKFHTLTRYYQLLRLRLVHTHTLSLVGIFKRRFPNSVFCQAVDCYLSVDFGYILLIPSLTISLPDYCQVCSLSGDSLSLSPF